MEQAWKKIHQKAVDEGISLGWQLWRKLYTGADDPYEYVTLQTYENFAATFTAFLTPEWAEEVYTLDEQAEIMEKTMASRAMIRQEVYHLAVGVDNPQAMKYLVIMRNNIPPERYTEYFQMEREIFKPFQEEVIRRGGLAQWGIWTAMPHQEGQAEVVIAEGYKDVKQLTDSGIDGTEVLATVHPELNWEELRDEVIKNRTQTSVEIWELVDFVVPGE